MAFKNISLIPLTTGLLISTLFGNVNSVNAFQYGLIAPPQINASPSGHADSVDVVEPAPTYSAKQTEPSNDEMDWFGTFMRFPATRSINSASFRIKNAQKSAIHETATGNSPSGLGIGAAQIIVHPPQHSGPNQFSFLIENAGSEKCARFSIEFSTPKNVSIVSVYPVTNSLTQNSAVVRIDRLVPGEKTMVHVLTSPAASGSFDFQTHVQLSKTQAFPVQTDRIGNRPVVHQEKPKYTSPYPKILYKMASARGPAVIPDAVPATNPESAGAFRKTSSLNRNTEIGVDQVANASDPIRRRKISPDSSLATSLAGAKFLKPGTESEFEIEIRNPLSQPATEIIAQLQLPPGLTIANLDRAAWIDKDTRIVSWKVETIAPRSSEIIRYRVQVLGSTEQTQRVTVGMNEIYQGSVEMTSRISDPEKSVRATNHVLE